MNTFVALRLPHADLLAYDDTSRPIWSQHLDGLIVVTSNSCPDYLLHLLSVSKARGIVLYDGCAERLQEAVSLVCAGKAKYFGPILRSVLTGTEREALHGVAKGLSNKQIGRDLNKSEHTVKNQLASVMRKLGLSSRAELRLYYLGWLEAPGLAKVA